MPAISDRLLAAGCASQIEAIHGEPVEILSGPDAGKVFQAVREIQSDQILTTELGEDPRAKIFLRFRDGNAPQIGSQGKVKTDDGRRWNAVRQQQASFLTQDYELTEITDKDSVARVD